LTVIEERTRLLVVIPTLEIGGAERQMTLLLKGLNPGLYSLGIVCCRLKGELVSEIPAHVRHYDLGKRSRWDFPFLVLRLRAILEEFRPEFVVASLEYAELLTWLSSQFIDHRVKIIARKEIMPSQSRWGESFSRIKRALDRVVNRQVDMIVAPSAGILEEVSQHLTRSRIPLVRIPNAVDLERLAKPASNETDSSGKMVVMGRFVAWKGFDIVLHALSLLPNGLGELHLIGDGPERKTLEGLSRDLNLTSRVHFHGYHPDPFPLLRQASFGILPSRFEPFGNVIVEMFAVGLPVIAFDVNYGPREIIRSGQNGILLRDRNPSDLAQAMIQLLSNAELRQRLGNQAREEAVQRYSIKKAISSYEECFALLRSNRPVAEASRS
jgi:glycosyltransferase involved in cell wall biosynthesis